MALTGTSSPPEVAAAPVALPARPPTVSDRGRSRPAVAVGALALAAALWAVAASALFVPRLTDNGDVIVQFFCAVASGQPFTIRVVKELSMTKEQEAVAHGIATDEQSARPPAV